MRGIEKAHYARQEASHNAQSLSNFAQRRIERRQYKSSDRPQHLKETRDRVEIGSRSQALNSMRNRQRGITDLKHFRPDLSQSGIDTVINASFLDGTGHSFEIRG